MERLSTLLPVIALGFAGLGILLKYFRRSQVTVNCWFCNTNCCVPYKDSNSWTCKRCDQYNGFLPDGDYNRDILAQSDSSFNSKRRFTSSSTQPLPSENGLCGDCNRNQEMKVVQLATFQPIDPKNYDTEIENFRCHLERAFRLCNPCEQVLSEKLSQKKTLVLDMHLKLTNQKVRDRKPSSDALSMTLIRAGSTMTTALAFVLILSMASLSTPSEMTLPTPNMNNASILRFTSQNSLLSTLLPSSLCFPSSPYIKSQQDQSVKPTIETKVKTSFSTNHLYIALCGLVVQCGLARSSGRRLGLLLWLIQLITVGFHQFSEVDSLGIQTIQVLVAVLTIVLSSWGASRKVSSPGSLRKLSSLSVSHQKGSVRKIESRPSRELLSFKNTDCRHEKTRKSLITLPATSEESSKASPTFETRPPIFPVALSNGLTVPAPPTLTANPVPTVAPLPSMGSSIPLPLKGEVSSYNQDDAESNASVDSAFSNPDSSILEAESLSCLNNFVPHEEKPLEDSSDGLGVHFLIKDLSLGTSSRTGKKAHEFQVKQYRSEQKRKPLLSPPKLSSLTKESYTPDKWSTHPTPSHGNSVSPVSLSPNQASRYSSASNLQVSNCSGSPSCSVYSQDNCIISARESTFQPAVHSALSAWSRPMMQHNVLSVCVPGVSPNSMTGNPYFPHYMNSPYGLSHQYHQYAVSPMWNPGVFMVPPQSSPYFANQSPTHVQGRNNSKNSSSATLKKLDSFEFGSDDEDNMSTSFSTKSRSRGPKSALSSSFIESVWESRFPILYTTVFYTVLGSLACAVWYSRLFFTITSSPFHSEST